MKATVEEYDRLRQHYDNLVYKLVMEAEKCDCNPEVEATRCIHSNRLHCIYLKAEKKLTKLGNRMRKALGMFEEDEINREKPICKQKKRRCKQKPKARQKSSN
jgi:hypothetical protein